MSSQFSSGKVFSRSYLVARSAKARARRPASSTISRWRSASGRLIRHPRWEEGQEAGARMAVRVLGIREPAGNDDDLVAEQQLDVEVEPLHALLERAEDREVSRMAPGPRPEVGKRETPVGERRLWRYLRIEARVGRKLFFAE
jgi:hypothetical protein